MGADGHGMARWIWAELRDFGPVARRVRGQQPSSQTVRPSPLTGVPWWRFLPLGLVERGLALTEVAAVVVLGLWARRATRVAPREAAMIGG